MFKRLKNIIREMYFFKLGEFYNNRLKKKFDEAYIKSSGFRLRSRMAENLSMILIALVIGALAGFGAVGIRALIREISYFSFEGPGSILENIIRAPWYMKLLVPVVGGMIVGPIIYRFAQEAKGTGVPEVMQAVLVKSGHIRPRVALFKTIVSTITIGTGGSVGREGPIIQIGASIGSSVAQFLRIPAIKMKTLVGCGAAAGIAAAFNAPIAGALFAVEIILMDYAVAQFSPIVIASVMATVVSHSFEGDFPAIEVLGNFSFNSFLEIWLYFPLGILSGIIAFLFIKYVYKIQDIWDRKIHLPDYMKPAAGGLSIGLIALFFPQIMGVGYDSINLALNSETMHYMGIGSDSVNSLLGGSAFWIICLALVFVKIFSTSLTLGSGGSGGIFAPSLFIGTMLGSFFGYFAHQLFPDSTAGPGAYALIAMGGLVAGTTRAPITAIITIFELTKETTIILPLMITCIISTIVSSFFSKESIYTLKLLKRKVWIKERHELNIMKSIHVNDVYKQKYISIPEDTRFDEIVNIVTTRRLPYVSVHSRDKGIFMGIVSLHDIKELIFEAESLQNVCIAGDIASRGIKVCMPEEDCKTTLRKMRSCNYYILPVMDKTTGNKQVGVIKLADIVYAYEKEIEKIDITSNLADKIAKQNLDSDVRFLDGYLITELEAPPVFTKKSIKELNFRNAYGADILSIKSHSKTGATIRALPQADYVIESGDILILAGKIEDIEHLKTIF